MKLVGNPSSNSRATTIECAGDPNEELNSPEPMETRVPQMLPPQAGFSNDFLFNELLDLWV